MSNQLHIVNGTAAIHSLKANNIQGDFLEWRDVLHDGPLGPANNRYEFLKIRAKFIASVGWEEENIALTKLQERDLKLNNWNGEVILWNSHEMFDQLQLLDILNCCDRKDLSIIFINDYLYKEHTSSSNLLKRHKIETKTYKVAEQLWAALVKQDINHLSSLLSNDLPGLPFMRDGLQRYILEQPNEQGINQTDNYILEELTSGPLQFGDLFRKVQKRESIRFMGDSSFWLRLKSLESLTEPRIKISEVSDIRDCLISLTA